MAIAMGSADIRSITGTITATMLTLAKTVAIVVPTLPNARSASINPPPRHRRYAALVSLLRFHCHLVGCMRLVVSRPRREGAPRGSAIADVHLVMSLPRGFASIQGRVVRCPGGVKEIPQLRILWVHIPLDGHDKAPDVLLRHPATVSLSVAVALGPIVMHPIPDLDVHDPVSCPPVLRVPWLLPTRRLEGDGLPTTLRVEVRERGLVKARDGSLPVQLKPPVTVSPC